MNKVFHSNISFDCNLFCHAGVVHSHFTKNVNFNFYVFPICTSTCKSFVHTGVMLWNVIYIKVKLLQSRAYVHFIKDRVLPNIINLPLSIFQFCILLLFCFLYCIITLVLMSQAKLRFSIRSRFTLNAIIISNNLLVSDMVC